MNEKLLNLEKTTASVLSVLLLIYGWKLLINNITYSQKFRTTLHKMVLLEVVVHFFGNKDIPARSIHLWIIKAYFRQSYMEENPIWKKILYGRKSFMEENPIWKKIFYGRKSYMEEYPIWKKILYGRKSYMEENQRLIKKFYLLYFSYIKSICLYPSLSTMLFRDSSTYRWDFPVLPLLPVLRRNSGDMNGMERARVGIRESPRIQQNRFGLLWRVALFFKTGGRI